MRAQSPPAEDAEAEADIPDYEELPHFTSRMAREEVGNLLGLLTGRPHLGPLLQHLQLKGPEDLEGTVHYVPSDLVAARAAAPEDVRPLAKRWAALRPESDRWEGDEAEGHERWLEELLGFGSHRRGNASADVRALANLAARHA